MAKKIHLTAPREGALKTYIIAFATSILLTLASYFCVVKHILTGWALVYTIVGFGLIQAFVQLIFFLHLGKESKPRWNLHAFFFMVMVLVIIAGGSIWIMHSLTVRLMPPM